MISCETVVDVDLQTAAPRLVIEAAINWQKGTDGKNQVIKLSTTTGFYDTEIPTVSGATVYIKNSDDLTFNFEEIPNTGNYVCNNFIPVINETYSLTVISNGSIYTAVEKMTSVVPIIGTSQNDQGGFAGENIEIKAYFNDPANEKNYYLFQYSYDTQVRADFYADQDQYYNGNEFFSISQNEDLVPGEKIKITHYGISKSYYNYMNIVVSIAGQSGGGPFQSPPATIRGNIINATNSSEFPFGYFSLSETDSIIYTIQ